MNTISQAITILDIHDNVVTTLDNLNKDNNCTINYYLSPLNETLLISKSNKTFPEYGLLKDLYNQYFSNLHEGKIIYNLDTVKIATLIINNKTRINYKLIPDETNNSIVEEIEIANYNV